jgi:hypothetical protein
LAEDILKVSITSDSFDASCHTQAKFGVDPYRQSRAKALVGEGEGIHEEHPLHYLSNGVQKFALNVSLWVDCPLRLNFGGVGYQSAVYGRMAALF